ncbi:MAG: ATP-binding protein [Thermoproteota archaeon]
MTTDRCSLCRAEAWKHFISFSREKLCDSCFRRRFLERVRGVVNRSKIFKTNSKLVLGVSGSCESIAMAKVMWKLESKYKGVRISFVYVSRWSEREEEEAILDTFKELGLPTNDLKIVSLKAKHGFYLPELVEERIIKHEMLCRACRSLVPSILIVEASKVGADVLLYADTADELAEEGLFLLGIGRNERLKDLGVKRALSAGRIWLFRPLSHVLKSEAESYLNSYGIHAKYLCPYRSARRVEFSGFLTALEAKHPGAVFSALRSFLDLN